LLYSRRAYIPECLSCYNRHIGSYSKLIGVKSLEEIIRSTDTIKKIPEWASWAEDLINWLDELTKQTVHGQIKHL